MDRYLALVALLGVPTPAPLDWPLPLGTAPAGFSAASPYILFHPFSRGAGKSLAASDVAAFCRALAPRSVVLAGRTEEAAPPLENVENLFNRTTLPELIWLIRHATYVVSVDSGPMHIAAALTSRLVSIHTWSDPRKVGPYQPEAWIWQDGALFRTQDIASPGPRRPALAITDLARHVVEQLGP